MLGVAVLHRDEGEIDVAGLGATELDLGLLSRFLEAAHGLTIRRQVDAARLLEFGDAPMDDALVEIIAAEAVVARGCLDLNLWLAVDLIDLEHGHVEGAAAEVEDEDRLVVLLVDTVGQGCCRRLVDDAQNVEAGDAARILGRLALGVGEVGGARDHGLFDLLTEVGLGVGLQLL